MSIDSSIEQSIRTAVEAEGQPAEVADKIVKWLSEIMSGNERVEDKEAAYRRLDGLCASVQVAVSDDQEQE